jgi:NCAIR mutase (PurE)-related protein
MTDIHEILQQFKEGKISEEEVLKLIKIDYIEKIGDLACLDIFRKDRTGIPEVIYAQSKSTDILIEIIQTYLKSRDFVLISRIRDDQIDSIEKIVKSNADLVLDLNKRGKIARIYKKSGHLLAKVQDAKVGIITAGTSDIPIAEEAKMIVEAMGCTVFTSYDIGIAGLHRIFEPLKKMLMENVDVIIVIAGMEGTLPGVVSALVDVPVIGVPTSSGYGYKGNGEGALTTMLQSCSPGLSVVNIDNGFGAAACASLISLGAHKKKESKSQSEPKKTK